MSWSAEVARPPRLSSIPSDLVCAADYEPWSRRVLDDASWAFLDGGAADEQTRRDNRIAWDHLRLTGAVLRDLRGGHTRMRLLGQDLPHPMLLAPVAHQGLFHPEAELATAQAAHVMQTPMVLSTLSHCSVEDVAARTSAPLWFQLYWQADLAHNLGLLRRAEAAGCQALVLTVDAPVAGVRNREQRAGFRLPSAVNLPHLAGLETCLPPLPKGGSPVFEQLMAFAPRWEDLARLREATRLPLWLKGIIRADDAERAIASGVDGLVVSNHGGRTLDGLPATAELLPGIVAAVQRRVPVLVDGGIRRGSDVFKALALGADAVLLGRCWVHALAAAGALGVAHVIRTLHEELEITMALAGCRTLDEIGPHALWQKTS